MKSKNCIVITKVKVEISNEKEDLASFFEQTAAGNRKQLDMEGYVLEKYTDVNNECPFYVGLCRIDICSDINWNPIYNRGSGWMVRAYVWSTGFNVLNEEIYDLEDFKNRLYKIIN